MWSVLEQVTIAMISIMMVMTSCRGCEPGWFGDKCMYMCHCKTLASCLENGECTQGEACALSFFGPGCQYEDWVSGNAVLGTPSYLTDQDGSTCNPDSYAETIELKLKVDVPVSWIRIVVKNENYDSRFVLKINEERPCMNERRFIIDNKQTLDVTCDEYTLFSTIWIEGTIASVVCSIFMSAGRNVAIKQKAIQSSERELRQFINGAANAVDGNTSADSTKNLCTETYLEVSPEWRLQFNNPQVLVRIQVYSTNDTSERPRGLALETLAVDGTRTYFFKDVSLDALAVYSLDISSRIPVVVVKIKLFNETNELRILRLCEVQTIGETVCPIGRYGLWCQYRCTCKNDEICNMVTGACVPGCQTGFYGFNCRFQCSDRCHNHSCLDSGVCVKCSSGYSGENCLNVCDRGYFGADCMYKCSEHCSNVCNHRTGRCSCKNGYVGHQCTDCSYGKYGQNCSLQCPKLCYSKICHIVTGECMSCVSYRTGKFCQDCAAKFYGTMCERSCSPYCINGTCDKVYGNCSSCTHRYIGRKCEISPPNNNIWVILIAFTMMFLILLFCLGFCLRRADDFETAAESYDIQPDIKLTSLSTILKTSTSTSI